MAACAAELSRGNVQFLQPLGFTGKLFLPRVQTFERILQLCQLFASQVRFGLSAAFGELLLSFLEILFRGGGLLFGLFSVSLLARLAGLLHLSRGSGGALPGRFGLQAFEPTRQPRCLILDLLLLACQPLEPLFLLGRVRLLGQVAGLFSQAGLLGAQLGHLPFGRAQLFDQPR